MNILFRADSSSTIGIGHIMRDLVLAKQYKDSNIIFATQKLDGNINSKIIEAGYKVEILNSNSIDEVQKLIDSYSIDMIIIDHYGIDYRYEKKIKSNNQNLKILSFDDTYNKHYCDILLNHNISADKHRYKGLVPTWCEIRCGGNYTLIRDEFIEEKKIKREKIYNIFIAMGGADSANLNIKILEVLPKDLKIVTVTTLANRNLDKLKEFVKDRENIRLEINSNKISKLINQSKFAIITPSVTVYEVIFMEVPFIAIMTADNQVDIYNYLLQNGYTALKQFNSKELKKAIEDFNGRAY